jgi:hypothetical protein
MEERVIPVTTNAPALRSLARPVPVPLWAWALVALALFAMYVLLQENGAVLSADQAMYLHELTHDARHALGVPCH